LGSRWYILIFRGLQTPKNIFGAWIGVFKPHMQNWKRPRCWNYSIDSNQTLHSDRVHKLVLMDGPKMPITNPIWRTAAILKKSKNGRISATYWPIGTKFGMMMQTDLLSSEAYQQSSKSWHKNWNKYPKCLPIKFRYCAVVLRISGKLPAPILNGGDSFGKWKDFQLSRARDLDLGSGHTAYRRASHAKLHGNRRHFVDGWMYVRTDKRTFDTHFIRSTQKSRPKKCQMTVGYHFKKSKNCRFSAKFWPIATNWSS